MVTLPAQPPLGGDDDVFAAHPRPQGIGEDPFGLTEPVGLSGVEEGDAVLEGAVDGGGGGVGIDRSPFAAEGPGAEGDGRDLEIGPAQSNVVHCSHFLSV